MREIDAIYSFIHIHSTPLATGSIHYYSSRGSTVTIREKNPIFFQYEVRGLAADLGFTLQSCTRLCKSVIFLIDTRVSSTGKRF